MLPRRPLFSPVIVVGWISFGVCLYSPSLKPHLLPSLVFIEWTGCVCPPIQPSHIVGNLIYLLFFFLRKEKRKKNEENLKPFFRPFCCCLYCGTLGGWGCFSTIFGLTPALTLPSITLSEQELWLRQCSINACAP